MKRLAILCLNALFFALAGKLKIRRIIFHVSFPCFALCSSQRRRANE